MDSLHLIIYAVMLIAFLRLYGRAVERQSEDSAPDNKTSA